MDVALLAVGIFGLFAAGTFHHMTFIHPEDHDDDKGAYNEEGGGEAEVIAAGAGAGTDARIDAASKVKARQGSTHASKERWKLHDAIGFKDVPDPRKMSLKEHVRSIVRATLSVASQALLFAIFPDIFNTTIPVDNDVVFRPLFMAMLGRMLMISCDLSVILLLFFSGGGGCFRKR
jgi:hypothetical protein